MPDTSTSGETGDRTADGPATPPGPAELTARIDALVHDEPGRVLALAESGLDAAGTPAERAIWAWGLARAHHEMGDVAAACAVYDRAALDARAAGDDGVLARVRISQALAQADAGDVVVALATLDEAAALVPPDGRQRVLNQRCLVLYYAGRFREARACAHEALALAVEHGDVLTEARAAVNRGIVHLQMGDLAAAEVDFERARGVAESGHQELMRCTVVHNLALLHARRGDFARALRDFAEVAAGLDALHAPARSLANLERDRAECLLLAGFAAEAAAIAERAEDLAVAWGNATTAAECALLAANAHLRAGDGVRSAEAAGRARAGFSSAGRAGWVACADFAALEAQLATDPPADREGPGGDGPDSPEDARRARLVLAEELRRYGRRPEALHVRVIGALLDLRRGDAVEAADQLAAAIPARADGPLDLRVRCWHATALVHLAAGRRAAARVAIEHGMQVIEDHVALLAAPDIRAAVAAQGARLAGLGLTLAREDGDAADVFHWADRWRAGTLTVLSLRSAADGETAGLLSELRAVTASTWHAEPGSAEAASLDRRAAALQTAVTDRSRSIPGDAPLRPATDAAAVGRALAGRCLVEYARVGDALVAVVLASGREPRVVDLGAAPSLTREVMFSAAALRRLATGTGADGPTLIRRADAGLDALDRRLVVPLALGDGPVVVIPAPELHDVAWSGLPSFRHRPVTVAPSAAAWMATADDGLPPQPPRLGVITGPGLVEADAEGREVARHWADAGEVGTAATVPGALALAGRCDVLHIAAHGRFCAENPTLSAISLADGDLTVHDLAHLAAVPRVAVLASCGLARSARYGDEVVGFAHTLLGLGARAVIAPVLSVPDTATRSVMVAVHDELRRGTPPADALAAARAGADPHDPAAVAAAWAFTCLGTRGASGPAAAGGA